MWISSGGFLALFASLFVNVDKVICQSYLSNFKYSFIENKSSINSVSFLAKFNFYSIAKFLKNKVLLLLMVNLIIFQILLQKSLIK